MFSGNFRIPQPRFLTKMPWHVIAFITLSLAGGAQIIYATNLGPVAHSDSTEYIVAARNLLSGNGLGLITPTGRLMPLYLHPPLYSLVISGPGAFGLDLLEVSRWLNALLFALLIAIVGMSSWWLTNSKIIAVSLSILVTTSPFLLGMFTRTLAEPLFLILGIASLVLAVRSAVTERQSLLIAAAVMAGLSVVSRYIGLAFVIAGAGFVFSQSKNGRSRNFYRTLAYLGIGLAPLLLWTIYLQLAHSGTSARQFVLPDNIWIELAPFRIALVDLTWSWIGLSDEATGISYRVRLLAIPAAAAILVAAVVSRSRISRARSIAADRRGAVVRAFSLVSMFSITYLGLLAYTYVFYFPKLDLIMRLFSPFLLTATTAALLAAYFISMSERFWRWQVTLFAMIALVVTSSQLPNTVSFLRNLHQYGGGYTGLRWQSSQTMSAVYALDPNIPLISNETSAIMLLADRSPFELPELESHAPLPIDMAFGDGSTRAERAFREEGAALVLFDTVRWQMAPVYGESTSQRLGSLVDGLFLYRDLEDGSIYFYQDPARE